MPACTTSSPATAGEPPPKPPAERRRRASFGSSPTRRTWCCRCSRRTPSAATASTSSTRPRPSPPSSTSAAACRARKLAAAVGHSEGWVRTRLSLLTLPDCALDALHAGTITLDVATALTDVLDEPDLIEELLRRPNLSVWQIEAAARQHTTDKAVDEASAALDAAGLRAVSEAEWREEQRSWKTLDDLGTRPGLAPRRAVPRRRRQARFDATVVEIPICTEPRRHRGRKPDSELVVPQHEPTTADRQQQLDRRGRKEASEARAAWLSERLRWPSRSGSGRGAAGRRDVDRQRALRRCRAGIPQPRARPLTASSDRTTPRLLHAHLAADPKRVTAVAVALVAATCEERARHSLTSSTVARYLDAIERLGYQPTDWEHTQRLTRRLTATRLTDRRPRTPPRSGAFSRPTDNCQLSTSAHMHQRCPYASRKPRLGRHAAV